MRYALLVLLALITPAFGQTNVLMNYRDSTGNVTQATANTPFPITGQTNDTTYSSGDVNIANTGAGDVLCIAGSATKTVYVKRFRVSGTATSAIITTASVIKRSALGSGGTPVTETLVPNDSANPASTATVTGYTVSPTSGAAVGTMRTRKVAVGVQGATATSSESLFDFADYYDQPLVLRGVAQNACINTGAAGSGGSWAVDVEWTEETP